MNDQSLILLTIEQARTLEVLKKYGFGAANTDLCILTGGLYRDDKFISEDRSLKGRTGFFWTQTKFPDFPNQICDISKEGSISSVPQYWRCRAIRPVLQPHAVYSEAFSYRTKGYNGIYEVQYGEYPQDAVPFKMQRKLELEYNNGLSKTGRTYTFDSVKYNMHEDAFLPITYDEYEYKGKKYIRVVANSSYGDSSFKLSNCCHYKNGDSVWIEVLPVIWLIDEKEELLIAKKGLVSGIRFLDKGIEYNGDFNQTEIKMYLDKYMMPDLIQSKSFNPTQLNLLVEKDKIETKQEKIKKAQIDRLLLAQQKLKEAAELLNSPIEDLKFNRIKLNDLSDLVFKNGGNFNEKGYVEFDEFFKDNAILKMIDFSDLDLTNVDITNMDFSGTNVHIDPQVIYNKDMTGVNALDVHFSPFMDSFDDVILDGAIINDKEAIIDLNKVKSYDENTVIENLVNSKRNR